MQDIITQAKGLKRPNLLVRAARYGVDDYAREPHLRRCLGSDDIPPPMGALSGLLSIEKQLNSERETKAGTYSIARHVDVLVGIMAETRTLQEVSIVPPHQC